MRATEKSSMPTGEKLGIEDTLAIQEAIGVDEYSEDEADEHAARADTPRTDSLLEMQMREYEAQQRVKGKGKR